MKPGLEVVQIGRAGPLPPDDERPVAPHPGACCPSGFNINRQFLRQEGMTPSGFRALTGDNSASGAAQEHGPPRRGKTREFAV